jgi:predicted outer membrane repeat protein
LTFSTFGNLIELTHNSKEAIYIQSVRFTNIYGAGVKMEPQDIFDTVNPLTLQVTECTFTDNTPWVSGFFNVYENSILKIDDSSFTNTHSAGSGSVVLANYKENTVIINNSTFTNNYAILGGAFYSQFSSSITCNFCTFTNNIAIRGGLSFLNSNGNIILNNCTITKNQALNAPILYISACQADFSEIAGSDIFLNNVITMDELLARNVTGTEHISDAFITEVTNNREFYEKSVSGSKKSAISMIKGKVRVKSGTEIYSQPDFLATFESEIQIIDSIFRDISLQTDHIIFHLLSSTFTYTNSTMQNIDCPSKDEAIFQVRLESIFNTNGNAALIKNTTCQFTFLLYSFAYLNDITFDGANLAETYIDSIESTLQFSSINLRNINTTATAIISVENSASLTSTDSNFESANMPYFYITGSTATFTSTTFQNMNSTIMRAAVFEESTVKLITSTFKNLKSTEQGGAVDTLNSNVNITGTTFLNNTAPIGGGVALRCEEGTTCTYSISTCNFTNNIATTNGGAIYYDFYKPTMSGNTFSGNVALYGPDMAAYPVKILPETIPNQTYVSGQSIVTEIRYKLVDVDGLTIATDSDSVITISPENSANRVIGNTDVTVVNGIATFSDITFISKPSAKNVKYIVSSSNIDETKISTAFSLSLANTTQTLTIDFRDCIKGEEQASDMCTPCPTGKYSLIPGASSCNICPKHATCMGKDVIYVDGGYWRSSFDSDDIHECLNEDACVKYEGTPTDVPYNCRKGYSSNL